MVSLVTFSSTFKTSSEVKKWDAYVNLSDKFFQTLWQIAQFWSSGAVAGAVPGSDGAALGQCGKEVLSQSSCRLILSYKALWVKLPITFLRKLSPAFGCSHPSPPSSVPEKSGSDQQFHLTSNKNLVSAHQ